MGDISDINIKFNWWSL